MATSKHYQNLSGHRASRRNVPPSFHYVKENSSNSNYHGEVFQAPADAAKEAKNTSAKLGLLNQFAYVFLPLQLTASIMAMKLRNFGTGNNELWTFLLILVAVATILSYP